MNVPSVFTVVVAGLGLVFAVLALLVCILILEGKIFSALDKKRTAKAREIVKSATVVPVVPSAAVGKAAPAPVIEAGIPPEVVAAITAAIAAMDGGKYTLRSLVRKTDGRGPWSVAATVSYTEPF